MRVSLPIDKHLDEIAVAVQTHGGAVVVAQPGAGKTSRVPTMLLDRMSAPVVCTQPRRIAARLSAMRVASERGTRLGGEIGYEVRFDRKVSSETQLRFVTEGLALRQWKTLCAKPHILVLDEFHERSIDLDILMAMAADVRIKSKSLGLVIMSATLDASPISEFLGGLPIIESHGRQFPVEINYLRIREEESLQTSVSRAVREILEDEQDRGDILVFLPGVGEIRRVQTKIQSLATERKLLVLPLHGALPPAEQDHAIAPSGQRKLVLATNVAETSLTIYGVSSVIDSGTARVARHSPGTGLPSLQVEPISQASAKQRAGRAGRTSEGRCIRLYSEHDLGGRRAFDAPEIVRSDLTAPMLNLANRGKRMSQVRWLTSPPPAALKGAEDLLLQLEAMEARGRITPLGRRMSAIAAHPRLGRLVVAGQALGVAKSAARAAALLSERPIRHSQRRRERARVSSGSDVVDDLDLLAEVERASFRGNIARAAGIDIPTAKRVIKLADQWLRSLDGRADDLEDSEVLREEALCRALLAGFPDRAARRVRPRSESIVLCRGGAVTQSRSSAVLEAEYLLAIDVETTGQRCLVRVASQIDPTWLLDLPGIRDVDEHRFESDRGRVVRYTGIYYGDIAIDEERIVDPNRMSDVQARDVLRSALIGGQLEHVVDAGELSGLRMRHEFAARCAPEQTWQDLSDTAITDALLAMSPRPTRLEDLRGISLLEAVRWGLPEAARGAVDKFAPTHVAIPARKRVVVHYEAGREPWIESRLQDFFGAQKGPSVGDGKVKLVLHLLAPNRRAVQVTTDLGGFWRKHYPSLRKQLMRRYPRHLWPEKP